VRLKERRPATRRTPMIKESRVTRARSGAKSAGKPTVFKRKLGKSPALRKNKTSLKPQRGVEVEVPGHAKI